MIRMRRLTLADADRTREWRNSSAISQYMYSDHEIGEAEHRAWIERAVDDPRSRYWIIELNERPVGLANFINIDRQHLRADWAFYVADPAARGSGVGSSVEVFMLDHAFGDLGLQRLCCQILANNEAVWKMHEKFGFVREGLLRRHIRKADGVHDVVVMGLLPEEWAERRPALAEKLERRGILAVEA